MSQPFLQLWGVLVVPCFHLQTTDATLLLNCQSSRNVFVVFPRSVSPYVVFLRKFFDVVVWFLRLLQTRSEPRSPLPCSSGMGRTLPHQKFVNYLSSCWKIEVDVGNAEMQNYCPFGKQSNFSDLAKSATTFTLISSAVWAYVDSFPNDYVDRTWPPI